VIVCGQSGGNDLIVISGGVEKEALTQRQPNGHDHRRRPMPCWWSTLAPVWPLPINDQRHICVGKRSFGE
jgi:hypothetical protein